MQERRRHKRYTVDAMEVNGRMQFATEVTVLNISVSGASFKADRRLDIGKEYTLKLANKDKVVSLRGVVVWSSINEIIENAYGDVIPIYAAGMKFTNVLNDVLIELINSLNDHVSSVSSEDRRLGGPRVNITTLGEANLNFSDNYKVKKISLSGMLIESGHALEIENKFPMEICLPDDKYIKCLGRVATCRLITDKDTEHYDIGVEFIELSEEYNKKLKEFILLYCNQDKNSSLFSIDENEFIESHAPEGKTETETTYNKPIGEQTTDIQQDVIDRLEHFYMWHKTMGYYKVLGLKEYARDYEIENAYYKMSQEFNPDMYPNISDNLKYKLTEIFNYITNAYSTLINPQKRKKYNATMRPRIK